MLSWPVTLRARGIKRWLVAKREWVCKLEILLGGRERERERERDGEGRKELNVYIPSIVLFANVSWREFEILHV